MAVTDQKPDELSVDPRGNGTHSLAEALRAFDRFHNGSNDVYDLTDAILRAHHGLETLFKAALFEVNPALLLDEDKKVKVLLEAYENFTSVGWTKFFEEVRTIGLIDAVSRVKGAGLLTGSDEREFAVFFDSIERMTGYRDGIQHLGVRVHPDNLLVLLGIALPRGVRYADLAFVNLAKAWRMYRPLPPIFGGSIEAELEKSFPRAKEVLETLSYQYDKLIAEALAFFTKGPFPEVALKLVIEDHGRVGAPPYLPVTKAEGFLSFTTSHWGTLSERPPPFEEQPSHGTYEAELTIDEPRIQSRPAEPPPATDLKDVSDVQKLIEYVNRSRAGNSVIEGHVKYTARLQLKRPSDHLSISGAEDKLSVLRNVDVAIVADLDYSARGLDIPGHLSVDSFNSASGVLGVTLNVAPKGMGVRSEAGPLALKFDTAIDATSAPFTMLFFREPNGRLKRDSPIMFRWTIDAHAPLTVAP